ncbi:MAG: bacillithiol biosynthesis deacetylase BshB1, partial [Myxococcota bacterium]
MTVDLVVFGAHPDDVEFCCGGWIARAAVAGQAVVVVDATRGECATNGTPEIRAAEATAAAEVLGLAARDNLGLPDGGLSDVDPDQLAAVVGAIRRHRPTLAVAPWTEARHPDHAALGRLAQKAAFFAGLTRYRPDLGPPFRPLRWLQYPERHDTRADLVVDVSGVYDRKWAAIRCHRSQLAGTETVLTRPVGLDLFEVRDRYWGATIGVTHGEPYLLGGPVRDARVTLTRPERHTATLATTFTGNDGTFS